MRVNEILRVSLPIVTPNLSGNLREGNRRSLGNANRAVGKDSPSFQEIFENVQKVNYTRKR